MFKLLQDIKKKDFSQETFRNKIENAVVNIIININYIINVIE